MNDFFRNTALTAAQAPPCLFGLLLLLAGHITHHARASAAPPRVHIGFFFALIGHLAVPAAATTHSLLVSMHLLIVNTVMALHGRAGRISGLPAASRRITTAPTCLDPAAVVGGARTRPLLPERKRSAEAPTAAV